MALTVLILNGYPRSGKDEFYKQIPTCYSKRLFSTIDTPKKILVEYYGWKAKYTSDGWVNEDKTEHIRRALSDLKDWSTKYFDAPFKETCEAIQQASKDGIDFLVTMIREPEEIERVFKYCQANGIDCRTILIKRKAYGAGKTHADRNVEAIDYTDVVYNNWDLDRYKKIVKDVCGSIKSGKTA